MGALSDSAYAWHPALLKRLIAGARRALPRLIKGQQMSEPPEQYDETHLARLVERYQQLAADLASAHASDELEDIRAALRAELEQLWPILETLVRPLAWGWVRRHLSSLGGSRGMRDAFEGVMASMCMHILDTLASRPIAATPPIGPLLKRIARNRMVDELRHSRRHSPDQPAPTGRRSAEPPPTALPISLEDAALCNHPVLSLDIAVQLDDRLYREECLAAIEQYWQLRLSADESLIMHARFADPPVPYGAIAAMFTPPWTPEAVRKRYSRIIADTRAHLQALELLSTVQVQP